MENKERKKAHLKPIPVSKLPLLPRTRTPLFSGLTPWWHQGYQHFRSGSAYVMAWPRDEYPVWFLKASSSSLTGRQPGLQCTSSPSQSAGEDESCIPGPAFGPSSSLFPTRRPRRLTHLLHNVMHEFSVCQPCLFPPHCLTPGEWRVLSFTHPCTHPGAQTVSSRTAVLNLPNDWVVDGFSGLASVSCG